MCEECIEGRLGGKLIIKSVIEILEAYGHPNVRATHKTTFEITKEPHLTLRGDCVLAVKASKGAADLNSQFKETVMKPHSKITVILKAGKRMEIAVGSGHLHITLRHPTDLVARKSNFVCDRTLMVSSNKAACDFSRNFVRALQNPNQKVTVILKAEASE